MAPEIVKELPYGKAVDIWSIGVIGHILLSGSPPFYGKSKPEIYKSIVNGTPKFGRYKESLSNQAKEFILACLSKDPLQRPTAEELLQHPWLAANAQYPQVDQEVSD